MRCKPDVLHKSEKLVDFLYETDSRMKSWSTTSHPHSTQNPEAPYWFRIGI